MTSRIVFLVVALAACGGRLAEGDLDGGPASDAEPVREDTPGSPDAARQEKRPTGDPSSTSASPAMQDPPTPFFICPPDPPPPGIPCDRVGLVCRYDITLTECPSLACGVDARWRTGPPGC